MSPHAYSQVVSYKRWADCGLYAVAGGALGRLDSQDATLLLRLLDHMNVVDRIFQHHLQGAPHAFQAARSQQLPSFDTLAQDMQRTDDWYADHAAGLSGDDFEELLEFTFTSGKPARMTRGEILLHVCLHGAYHRGNAGLLLHKNGVSPNDDRLTDFLEAGMPMRAR